jgi:hypothetical protein
MDLLQPLLECRGKSGGMNHAMEVLTNYVRSYYYYYYYYYYSLTSIHTFTLTISLQRPLPALLPSCDGKFL